MKMSREAKNLKREVTALSVEHELLTAQVTEMRRFMREHPPIPSSPRSTVSNNNHAANETTDERLRVALEENADLSQQLEELNKMYMRLEQLLVDSKLQAATLDMEADQLTVELNRKSEQLRISTDSCTQFEQQVQELTQIRGELEDRLGDLLSMGQDGGREQKLTGKNKNRQTNSLGRKFQCLFTKSGKN